MDDESYKKKFRPIIENLDIDTCPVCMRGRNANRFQKGIRAMSLQTYDIPVCTECYNSEFLDAYSALIGYFSDQSIYSTQFDDIEGDLVIGKTIFVESESDSKSVKKYIESNIEQVSFLIEEQISGQTVAFIHNQEKEQLAIVLYRTGVVLVNKNIKRKTDQKLDYCCIHHLDAGHMLNLLKYFNKFSVYDIKHMNEDLRAEMLAGTI